MSSNTEPEDEGSTVQTVNENTIEKVGDIGNITATEKDNEKRDEIENGNVTEDRMEMVKEEKQPENLTDSKTNENQLDQDGLKDQADDTEKGAEVLNPPSGKPTEDSHESKTDEEAKVLVERNGKFVYVDAKDVTLEKQLESLEDTEKQNESRTKPEPVTNDSELEIQKQSTPPRSPARPKTAVTRAKSARTTRGPPQQHLQSPRPKSAAPTIGHSPGFNAPPGARLVSFSSQDARDAYEGWFLRKQEQLRKERERTRKMEEENAEEPKDEEMSKAAFEGWKRRKEEEMQEKRKRAMERSSTTQKPKKDPVEAEENFKAWCKRKEEKMREESERERKVYKKPAKELTPEQMDALNDQAVKEWMRQKYLQQSQEKKQLQRTMRHHAKEAKKITANLQKIYLQDLKKTKPRPVSAKGSKLLPKV
eukprot:m.107981 g.107981  ORF g.107981 m.107981 type:complete len:422 (-) comp13948_c0_seq7:3780-5045(-)